MFCNNLTLILIAAIFQDAPLIIPKMTKKISLTKHSFTYSIGPGVEIGLSRSSFYKQNLKLSKTCVKTATKKLQRMDLFFSVKGKNVYSQV